MRINIDQADENHDNQCLVCKKNETEGDVKNKGKVLDTHKQIKQTNDTIM